MIGKLIVLGGVVGSTVATGGLTGAVVAGQVLFWTIGTLWRKIKCIPRNKREMLSFFEEAHKSAVEAGETLNAIGMHGTCSDMRDRVKRLQFFVQEVVDFCSKVDEQNWMQDYWTSLACQDKITYIRELKDEIDTEIQDLRWEHRSELNVQAMEHRFYQILGAARVTDGTVTAQQLNVQDATHDNDGAFFQQVLDVVRKQSSTSCRSSGEGATEGSAPARVDCKDKDNLVSPRVGDELEEVVVDPDEPTYDYATSGPVVDLEEPIYDYATNGRLILIEYAEGHVYWCATQRLEAELEALSKEENSRPLSMFGKLFGGIASLFRRSPKVSPKVDRKSPKSGRKSPDTAPKSPTSERTSLKPEQHRQVVS
eukprot:m.34568 g.34568  ORF g.34568 m.34568 type:complete len:368 (+) comp5155_c0_seq1:1102-2205(+)